MLASIVDPRFGTLLPDLWERNNSVNDLVNALNEALLLLSPDWLPTLREEVLDEDLRRVLEQSSVQGI